MNRAVYTVTSGGLAALERLEVVTQNLANVGTAGYKAEYLVFRVQPLDAGPGQDPLVDQVAAQVVEAARIRDFSQGPIRPSGNPLDVAIAGEGFFAVATPRGERYTRQGTFSRDGEGYLVTQHGERVQGESGDLRLGAGDVTIGHDGTITSDGVPVGRLKVVGFGPEPALVPEGAALFAPAPGEVPQLLAPGAVRLEPEAIEGANVDAVSGMIELVDVARGFEAYMHAMQRLDEIMQRSIDDVGRV